MLHSHDIAMEIERTTYEGYGYEHILRNVVPYMKTEGITESQIRTMLVENPERILTII